MTELPQSFEDRLDDAYKLIRSLCDARTISQVDKSGNLVDVDYIPGPQMVGQLVNTLRLQYNAKLGITDVAPPTGDEMPPD